MVISCGDALWGAVVARMNLLGYLPMMPVVSSLMGIGLYLMGRVRG